MDEQTKPRSKRRLEEQTKPRTKRRLAELEKRRSKRRRAQVALVLLVLALVAVPMTGLALSVSRAADPTTTSQMTVAVTGQRLPSGQTVENTIFRSSDPGAGMIGLSGSGVSGATVRNVRFENLTYGMKIGSGSQSSGLSVDGAVATNNCQALFLANVSSSTFSNLDLASYYVPNAASGSKNHVVYLERGLHNLFFSNVTLDGGSGQTLQMYDWENRDQPSDNITFDGLTITNANHGPIVISGGFSHVTIKNLRATATGSDFPVIQLYGDATDVTIDGFECWGGQALIGTADNHPEHAVNVTLKNGIYHGNTLVYGKDKIDGLVIENVVSGGSTAPSTTSTTRATTTTTAPPTTTTTAPPTTTTSTTRPTTTTTTTGATTTTTAPATTTTVPPATTTTTLQTAPPEMFLNGSTTSADYWHAWNDTGSNGAVALVYDSTLGKKVIEYGVTALDGWGSFWGNDSILTDAPWSPLFVMGSPYTITFKARAMGGTAAIWFSINDGDGTDFVWRRMIPLTTSWSTLTFTFYPATQVGSAPMFYVHGVVGPRIRITDLSVRKSS